MTLTKRLVKGSALTAAEHDANMDHVTNGANIKASYESEADTNAYTDAAVSKLAGISTGATTWGDLVNSDIIPDADGTRDLGSVTVRFASLHVDSIDLNGTTLDGTTLADPGADAILFFDDSANTTAYLTTSAQLAGVITDETGTGALAFANDPKLIYSINAQTGTTYTLVLTDQHKKITMNNASANTLTIPTNASVAFPTGTVLGVSQIGAGATTVTGDTGVTVNGVSAGGAAIEARYSGVTLTKIGTDAWLMEGNHGTVA